MRDMQKRVLVGFVNEAVISTKFRPSLISAGGLGIPLLLKSWCYKQATFEKMKTLVQTLYDYNFVGTVTEENSDEEAEMTISTVVDSHPHDNQQLVSYSDIIETVIKEQNSDEEDEMETAVSESQPPHGDQPLVSSPDSDSDGQHCNSKKQPILDENVDEEIDLVLA